jgi:hypothetical protein
MKWYVYLICFVLVIAGTFCGIRLYALVTRESYINGSIDIENKFRMESFAYANTSVEFYHDIYDATDTYAYEIDLLRVDGFDGVRNNYQIVLNGYILTDTQITAGIVYAKACWDFYDTDGQIVCSSSLDISVKFLSDKTVLTLATAGGQNASFLTQYFKDNGIRLKVNQILNVIDTRGVN